MPKLLPLPGRKAPVLPLGLGTLHMGTRIALETCHELLDTFVAGGGVVVDTAAVYTDWIPGKRRRVEHLLGAWLRQSGKRDEVYLVTKGCHPVGEFDITTAGEQVRAAIAQQEIDGSLRALGVDHVDLWLYHRDDPKVPVEPLLSVLEKNLRAGKIGAYGASNWTVSRLEETRECAAARGYAGFAANQLMWNLASDVMAPVRDRSLVKMDPTMYQWHTESGLLAMPYSSLAGGFFTKKRLGVSDTRMQRYMTDGVKKRCDWLGATMRSHGLSASAVCLAHLWNRPFPVLPLVGPSDRGQLLESLEASRDPRMAQIVPAF